VPILAGGVPIHGAFASSVVIDDLPAALDLIDRIEGMRGPGSNLCGARPPRVPEVHDFWFVS
jgi:outer membrane cobalamin receptor